MSNMILKPKREFILLIENLFSLSIMKVVSSIIPFVTIPYLIRVLGFSNYGIVVLGQTLVLYFINICIYGYNISATRDIAKNVNDKKAITQLISEIITTQIFLLIISTIIFIAVLLSLHKFRTNIYSHLLFLPYMWGEVLFPIWFYRGIQKIKIITLITSLVKLLFTFCVFIFIKNDSDFWVYPLVYSIGSALSLLFSFYYIYKQHKFELKISLTMLKYQLKKNHALFLSDVSPMLYNNTTQLVMGVFLPSSALGLFDAIRKIPTIINVGIGIISNTLFPYLSRNVNAFAKIKSYYLIVTILLCLIPIGLIIPLFDLLTIPIDRMNISILIILMLGVLASGIGSIYGTNYLIVNNHESHVLKATVLASIIGFIMATPSIYYYGIIGGALNIACCQIMLSLLLFYFYKKVRV